MDLTSYSNFISKFFTDMVQPEKYDRIYKGKSAKADDKAATTSTTRTMRSYGLSNDDLQMKTNITNILRRSLQNDIQNVDIQPYPIETLHNILVLHPPPKFTQDTTPIVMAPIKETPAPKPRPAKTKGSSSKLLKHSKPDIASIYTDEQVSKRFKPTDDYAEDNDEYMAFVDSKPIEAPRGPPPGLYPAIKNILDHFWQMDYEPQSVEFAFLAIINAKNCQEFGLKDFAIESSSLAVIKTRADTNYYQSADEFEHDFRMMFHNIVTYYPRTHPAYNKAVELAQLFETKWNSLKLQIK